MNDVVGTCVWCYYQEESRDYQLLDQLEQALMEIEILKKEAFEESMRRLKAEKTAIEATRKVEYIRRFSFLILHIPFHEVIM